jgi:hypothetical protein
MSEPANQDEFQGDNALKNLRRAMGSKPDGLTRVGGILHPAKIKLAEGDIIFRFGNGARLENEDRSGPWWMTQATLLLNAENASNVTGLIATLRQNLALPAGFSPLDRVFGASVRQRLYAFAGIGTGIFREDLDTRDQIGAPPILLGGMERDGSTRGRSLCYQLFIPGLAASARNALAYGPVRTATEWFNLPYGQRQWP